MAERPVIHNTFVIERRYPKPPDTVFAAFADPAWKRRWFAEGANHEVEEFALVTIELSSTDQGTALVCTHQGAFYEGADGPQIREAGWRSLLDGLAMELSRS